VVALATSLQGQGCAQWRAAAAADVVDVAMPTDRRSAFPGHLHSMFFHLSTSCLPATSNRHCSLYDLPFTPIFSVVSRAHEPSQKFQLRVKNAIK